LKIVKQYALQRKTNMSEVLLCHQKIIIITTETFQWKLLFADNHPSN